MTIEPELFVKALDNYKFNDELTSIHTHMPTRTNSYGQFVDFVTLDMPVAANAMNRWLKNVIDDSVTDDQNYEVYLDLGDSPGSPISGHRLHLKRNYKLVSKSFIVEERSKGGKIVRRHNWVHDCHYTGVIHNHNSFSKVALSLCNGVVSCHWYVCYALETEVVIN